MIKCNPFFFSFLLLASSVGMFNKNISFAQLNMRNNISRREHFLQIVSLQEDVKEAKKQLNRKLRQACKLQDF